MTISIPWRIPLPFFSLVFTPLPLAKAGELNFPKREMYFALAENEQNAFRLDLKKTSEIKCFVSFDRNVKTNADAVNGK